MGTVVLPTQYYQVFDLDFELPVPSDATGGWKTADLPLAIDPTASLVMHAWDVGTREEFPGWHHVVEYFSRAEPILNGPLAEQLALWRVATGFGFVYGPEPFLHALRPVSANPRA